MSRLSKCIMKILCDRYDFCRLCLDSLGDDAIHVEDEVAVDVNNSQQMSKILLAVLGSQLSDYLPNIDFICSHCARKTISCFKFIKLCRNNSEQLFNAVEALSDCFENTLDQLDKVKCLYVSVATNNFTTQQYYDTQTSDSTATALKRYKTITKNSKKAKTPKIREFGEEALKICEVIREKNSPTKFKCKECSRLFNKLFNCKKHYYSKHSAKTYMCSLCSRKYGSEVLLKQHMHDSHSSMVCSKCGKKYVNRYSLLYHMRRHTGEQPYQCQHCGLKFQWSSRRAEHIRRFHMEPTVECNVCHIKFRTLGSMYEHRKRHFNPNSRLHVAQVVD